MERSNSVLSGLFKSDSQFSMGSIDNMLHDFGSDEVYTRVDVPIDIESQMNEIDEFLKLSDVPKK